MLLQVLSTVTLEMSGFPRWKTQISQWEEDYLTQNSGIPCLHVPIFRVRISTECIMVVCGAVGRSIHALFGDKFLNQSNVPKLCHCALFQISGILVVPGAAGGNIVGSILVKKLHMDCYKCARGTFIMSLLTMSVFSVFFIQCDNAQFHGVNVPNTSL